MKTWANTYANEYVNAYAKEYANEYGKKRYDEGFCLGKRAGFDEGKRVAEMEMKLPILQGIVEEGIDIKTAIKYLHIAQEDLVFYIEKLEKNLR